MTELKRIVLGIFLMTATCALALAQTQEETRTLAAFNGIAISNGIEATLVKGDAHGVEVIASGLELSRVESKVTSRILELKISGIAPKASSVKAVITYVALEEVNAGSGAKVFVKDPMESRHIKIYAVTGSYVEADVKAQDLILDAQTNAKIFVKGKATNLDFSAYTNAEIDGEKLETDNAVVKINTNAKGSFHVNESLTGTAATRGRVKYSGDPNIVDIKTNTGGAIDEQ